MIENQTWFVIINPTSGNGSSQRKWPKIQQLLLDYGFVFEFEFTKHPAHSIELLHESVNQGVSKIICVGGDGTIHNIVNGIMAQNVFQTSKINLGVIPIGTGNDWVKTYGISLDIEKAIQCIKNGDLKHQDVGKIELTNQEREPIYFNNLAGVGFDGYVVSKVQKYKKLGALAYIFGALMGMLSAKNFQSKTTFNSEVYSKKTLMILIGLCQYSGGGMQLTKEPNPSDGYFDISIAENFKGFDILKNLFALFSGKITNSKKIITAKTNQIKIEVIDKTLPFIQADGELIGQGDFKCSIIPKALSFYA